MFKRIVYVITLALVLFSLSGFSWMPVPACNPKCLTPTPVDTLPPTDIPPAPTDTPQPVPTATEKPVATPTVDSPTPTTAISTTVVTDTLPTATADSPSVTQRIKREKPKATPDCSKEKEITNGNCLPDTGFGDEFLVLAVIAFILSVVILAIRKIRKANE